MSKLFKKFLASFLVAFFLLITVATPFAHAQSNGTWYSQGFDQWYAKVYDTSNPQEIFGERYTAAQVQWVFYGAASFFLNLALGGNTDLVQCSILHDVGKCNAAVQKMFSFRDNAIPVAEKNETLLSQIFADRPLSGITYVKDLGRKFHLVPEAKAQSVGFGYQALYIIQDAWRAVRDLSYVFFVIVILVFAFMIMFRVKISPQVVITVQSALPKLVVGLILVTFSYAIAGFLIDLMYVIIGFISIIFSRIDVIGFSKNAVDYFNLFTKGPAIGPVRGGVVLFLVYYFLYFLVAWVLTFFFGLVSSLTSLTNQNLSGFIGGESMSALILLVGIILLIVLIILIIINIFKILLMLVKAFASILLLTIFAPLQLTVGMVVPGLGFGSWLKSFVSKLAVFPVTGALFMLAFWFLNLAVGIAFDQTRINLASGALSGLIVKVDPNVISGFNASFTQGWPPLLGGLPQMAALVMLVVSFMVFAMIPKAGDMVEGLISGKFAFGSAIGDSFKPFTAFGGAIYGTAQKAGAEGAVGYIGGRLAQQGGLVARGGRYLEQAVRRGRTVKEEEA
ncbi:MAG TPA: hypothetical protein VF185_02120 [Patescibacteria group bacterium]